MFLFTKRSAVVAVVYACALIGVQAHPQDANRGNRDCESTLCPKLGTFPKCSPQFYKALQACYAPPCNRRYLVDPAADCDPALAPRDRQCENTLCSKLNTFPKCSPRWYKALQTCYAPPCNIRYFVDPAADCKVDPAPEAPAPTRCEDTLCAKLSTFPDCSKEYYAALQACYVDPCNYDYASDPAAHCYT